MNQPAVSSMTAAPAPTTQELQARIRDLEEFTYRAAHDLKRPLVTIESFIEILKADVESEQYARLNKDLSQISLATTQMSGLISELLELARIGRLDLSSHRSNGKPGEQIDSGVLVDEVVRAQQAAESSAGVRFVVASDWPTVTAHRSQIREVLENLIDNAVKAAVSHEEPTVEVGVICVGERSVLFVADNGPGIDEADRQRVFDWFVQLGNPADGTGLGLPICKRIVEMHDGDIWIETDPNLGGTRFCFTLGS